MIKTHIRLLAVIMLPLLLMTVPSQKANAQDASISYQSDGISYQTFYDQLAPYGQWVNDPQYGSVWVPNVPPGFRPYGSDGHWVMTDQGNMWVSDQPWAWAAYHYGRWTYNPYYGWVWIPGYEWAPAWVNWRIGGGYYGWAPMGPGQVYGGYYDYPANYWIFVNPHYLYHPYVYNYYERGDMGMYVNRTEYVRYENRDRDRGQAMRYYGPPREDIERQTGQPVQVYHVSNAGSAGAGRVGGNEVSIYRPPVNRETVNSAHPANVIEGRDHPIGNRPEPVSANHETTPPAFRQEHPQQSQQFQQQREPQQQREQQFQQPQQQQREQPQQQREQTQQQPRQQPQQQQQKQKQQPQQQKGQQRGGQQRSKPKQQSEHR